ncbi:extracellular solute-binding protein [Planotetraspora sp. A-T 1434]|uniref:ABC transporter substrate-binding protein n=1 Tax=Planotetraspora sp. A-T 1434 TaxID=2979219 RepID=UPI0021C03D78|nr:extracellular solute-binding protein [Planotetraspora sp. A-T 1434]MCT9931287.1 extracellular solute-binding protein [Planotetraspora sp. A-T 1434]
MSSRPRVRAVSTATTTAGTALAAALALAACGTGGGGTAAARPSADPNAKIVVWADATRVPMVQEYQKAHPAAKIDLVTIPNESGYIETKVQLANRSGRGWPDVVFTGENIATLQAKPYDWAAPLDGKVKQDVVGQFAKSSVSNCTIEGHLYCLQNDIAQTVLWYDKGLMKQFGYAVPKTWKEYQELGAKVAADHPGYVVGALGAHGMLFTYYQSSGCPMTDAQSSTTVRINATAVECTRVNDLLQPMLDNGSVSRLDEFDPAFVALGTKRKILMLPFASWAGDFAFKPTYKTPAGQLAAAPMPTWEGESTGYSGAVGGGVWAVGKHAANPQGAVDLITWLTTDVGLQSKQPTYPAFRPAAKAWMAGKANDPYYAEDPSPVFEAQADLIRENWKYTRYAATVINGYNETVAKGIQDKQPLAGLLPKYAEQLTQAAKDAGYTVVQ